MWGGDPFRPVRMITNPLPAPVRPGSNSVSSVNRSVSELNCMGSPECQCSILRLTISMSNTSDAGSSVRYRKLTIPANQIGQNYMFILFNCFCIPCKVGRVLCSGITMGVPRGCMLDEDSLPSQDVHCGGIDNIQSNVSEWLPQS